MPLTPSSVAHKFNDFILKEKFDPQSNGLMHLDRWKFNGATVLKVVL